MANRLKRLFEKANRWRASERGASTIEYVAIAAVSAAVVGAVLVAMQGGGGAGLSSAVSSAMQRIAISFEPGGGSAGISSDYAEPSTGIPEVEGTTDLTGPSRGIIAFVTDIMQPGIGGPGDKEITPSEASPDPWEFRDASGQFTMHIIREENKYIIEGPSVEEKRYRGWTDRRIFRWVQNIRWLDWLSTRKYRGNPQIEVEIGGKTAARIESQPRDEDTWREQGTFESLDGNVVVKVKRQNRWDTLIDRTFQPMFPMKGEIRQQEQQCQGGQICKTWEWKKGSHEALDVQRPRDAEKGEDGRGYGIEGREVYAAMDGVVTIAGPDRTDGRWGFKGINEREPFWVTQSGTAATYEQQPSIYIRVGGPGYTAPGYKVRIDHGMRYNPESDEWEHVETQYYHTYPLSEKKVENGRVVRGEQILQSNTRVQQRELIGYYDYIGNSTGPHLHYEVIVNGNDYRNPENPLKK